MAPSGPSVVVSGRGFDSVFVASPVAAAANAVGSVLLGLSRFCRLSASSAQKSSRAWSLGTCRAKGYVQNTRQTRTLLTDLATEYTRTVFHGPGARDTAADAWGTHVRAEVQVPCSHAVYQQCVRQSYACLYAYMLISKLTSICWYSNPSLSASLRILDARLQTHIHMATVHACAIRAHEDAVCSELERALRCATCTSYAARMRTHEHGSMK